MAFKVPEKYRITGGGEFNAEYYSDESYGNNGAFSITLKTRQGKRKFTIIASDGEEWEHVSVSLPDRCPTWSEMSYIKGLFWGEDDCVMQLHPPKRDYINNHNFCLHLWRPMNKEIPQPRFGLVGVK